MSRPENVSTKSDEDHDRLAPVAAQLGVSRHRGKAVGMLARSMWKIIKLLGLGLTVLLALTQIWDWANKPSTKLSAQVQFGPFLMPPTVREEFDKLAQL